MNFGKAIVIGGGFSGLIAARVLSDKFDEVDVIERDSDSIIGLFKPRNGVPQSTQFHMLSENALLTEWFPHIDKALMDSGSYRIDLTRDVLYYQYGYKPLVDSGSYGYLHTRPLLEECIRAQFVAIPHVKFLYDAETIGLLAQFKNNEITGVRIFNKRTHQEENLYGNLVIDASGRSTHCPEWLEALGYGMPPTTKVRVDRRYATRIYRWPEAFNPPWKAIVITGKDKKGILSRIEEDDKGKRVMVTLSSLQDNFPVTAEGFLSFAERLEQPDIYDLIKDWEPLGLPLPFDIPVVRRHHYEKQARLPSHFIAIGDALSTVCSNDEHGMTSCILEGKALQQALKAPLDQITRRYYKTVSSLLDQVESRPIIDDFRLKDTRVKKSFVASFYHWYYRMVLELCSEDGELWKELRSSPGHQKNCFIWLRPALFIRVIMRSLGLTRAPY